MENEKIFISYSWDSPEHCDRVLGLANKLREEGIDAEIDQYEECPPEGWTRWMNKQIRDSKFVLCVCTEKYYKRVNGEEILGTGLGATWEGGLIYQKLYQQQGHNIKFIPIIVRENDRQYIPEPLRDTTTYCLEPNKDYDKLYARLIDKPLVQKPELGKRKSLEVKKVKTDPRTMFVTGVIDVDLWNKAKWNCTGFAFGVDAPPVLMIGYTNINYGLNIFNEWKKQYDNFDKNDEIRIAIIEGDIPNEDPGYSVHININHEFKLKQLKNMGLMSENPENNLILTIGRFNRMNPPNGISEQLKNFKKEYEKYGYYFISPCKYNELTGEITPFFEYQILKKELIFKNTKELKKDDVDYIVIKDPIMKA